MSEMFCEQIADVDLPIMRTIKTIDDLQDYRSREWRRLYGELPERVRPYVALAKGDFDAAARVLERWRSELAIFASERKKYSRKYFERNLQSDTIEVETLESLVLPRDPELIARRLHEFEAANVRRLKLEPFWQPSPLPIEEAAD
jgi:hypothetical protein